MEDNKNDDLWVILALRKELYAIPALMVEGMVRVPRVTPLPGAPAHVRGTIIVRDAVLAIVDLRVCLGIPSLQKEAADFCQLMEQRERDHRNWLNELEAAVHERREFRLATDPHKCAFGRWYDSFHADNLLLSTLLARFDHPHRAIHAIAAHALAAGQRGDHLAAQKIIDDCRETELSEMIRLFAELKTTYKEAAREIALIVSADCQRFALTADSIHAVAPLHDCSRTEVTELAEDAPVEAIGKTNGGGNLVQILDLARITPGRVGLREITCR